VLGVFLGVGLAFLIEFMDNTIKTKEDAEKILGLPVLGQIPDMTKIDEAPRRLSPRRERGASA